jgi:hypothetical protein
MEWNRGDLEGQARDHEDQADRGADLGRLPASSACEICTKAVPPQ